MNKKQTVVAWVMVIAISLVWCFYWYNTLTTTLNSLLISHTITIILGGLLIYVLRDKKE